MVTKIKLTKGQYALIDNEDLDFLNQWKWGAKYDKDIDGFYGRRTQHNTMINGISKNKIIMMHRAVMEYILGRELERNELIDHINHNPLDNRRDNLRIVSSRQNQQNLKRKTSSKYPGVHWSKQAKKWIARIRLGNNRKYLGCFSDEKDAAKAYEKACRELAGDELVCKA